MADKKSSDGELKTEILKKVANSVNPALGEAIEKTVTEKLSTEKTIKPKTSHKLSTKTQSVVKPVVKKIEKEDIKVSDTESKKKTAPKTIPVKHSNTSVSAHKPTKIKPAKKTLQTATDINGKKISEQVKKSVASEKTSGDFKAVRRINSVSQTSSKVSVKSATHSSLSSKKPDSHSENGNTVHNSRNNIEHTSHSENNSQNGSSFNSSNNLLNSSKTAKRFFENKQFRNRIIILAVVLIVVILIIAAVVNNGKKMIGNFLDDGTSRLDYSEIVNLVANGNCPDVKQDENKTGHDTGLNKDSGKEIVFKHIETCASTSDSSKTVSSILNSWMSHTKYNLYLHSFEFDSPEYEGNNPKSIITSTKSPFEGCGYRVESVTETLDRKYANECKDRLGSDGISFIKGVGYTGISLPLSVYGYSGTADYSAYITIYNVDASKNYNSDSLDLKSSLEASVASQDSATRSNVSISNLRDFYVDDDLNDNLAVQQPLYFASRNQTYIMKFDHGDYRWQFPTGTWFSDREIQGLDDIVNSL